MPWSERRFKGKQKVWVLVDDDGAPVLEDGLAPMKYSRDEDARVYNAHPRNISRVGRNDDEKKRKKKKSRRKAPNFDEEVWREPEGDRIVSEEVPEELADEPPPESGVIEIHTDGACSGNPGPAGYGVVIRWDANYRELSQYIGTGTNNIAELLAIKVALEESRNIDGRAVIHTDSNYSIGVLVRGWKAKANRALVAAIRDLIEEMDPMPHLEKVKGHAGIPLNERADDLATSSVQ